MKISVVMQSYLGEYPHSRKHPEFKFVRAVNSFLSQKHPDKELIIVSDGCDKTKHLYEQLYSHHPQIKLCYVAKKDSRRMYDVEKSGNTNIKYYRGTPRRLGCAMSEGDIVAYMDSDDIMLPTRLSELNDVWMKASLEIKWASNVVRYFHKNALMVPNLEQSITDTTKVLSLKDYGYDIEDDFYLNIAVPEGQVFGAPYGLSHRKDVKAIWKDSVMIMNEDNSKILSGCTEDSLYMSELIKLDGACFRQEHPSYVVCHFRLGLWDV